MSQVEQLKRAFGSGFTKLGRSHVSKPRLVDNGGPKEKPISPEWNAGTLRDNLLRLRKGDMVFVRPFYATLKAGKCWWVLSTEQQILYLVAESMGGLRLRDLVKYVIDSESRIKRAPPQSVDILEGEVLKLCKTSATSRLPIDTRII